MHDQVYPQLYMYHTGLASIENAFNYRQTRIKNRYKQATGDRWQSKTLFLTIFDLRSSVVLTFSIAAYPI